MPITTYSQTIRGLETLLEDMEARLAEMEQLTKTLTTQVGNTLEGKRSPQVDTTKLLEYIKPSHDR